MLENKTQIGKKQRESY